MTTASTVEPIEITIARVGHRVALGASMLRLSNIAVVVLAGLGGCASESATSEDGRDDSFTADGKLDGFQCTPEEAAAILQVANTATLATLKNDVQLAEKAADNIVAVRNGDDEVANTADDVELGTLAQLDAIPYIGPNAFQKLLAYVHDADLVGDPPAPSGQWTGSTIANGLYEDFALAPDGRVVLAYRTHNVRHLLLADGTQLDYPPQYAFATETELAIDAAGDPHLLLRQDGTVPRSWLHVVVRNGQLVELGQLPADTVWFDASPDGAMFALAARSGCSNCESSLALHTLGATSATTVEELWNVSKPYLVGFNVGLDGFPALAWNSTRHARRGANGWTVLDVTSALSSPGLATTGGANATVFASSNGVHTFRQNGGSFGALEVTRGTSSYISATTDGVGTAHACYIHLGNVVHLQATTTGQVTTSMHGNADACWLETDRAGKVHMVTRIGSVINHAVYE